MCVFHIYVYRETIKGGRTLLSLKGSFSYICPPLYPYIHLYSLVLHNIHIICVCMWQERNHTIHKVCWLAFNVRSSWLPQPGQPPTRTAQQRRVRTHHPQAARAPRVQAPITPHQHHTPLRTCAHTQRGGQGRNGHTHSRVACSDSRCQ